MQAPQSRACQACALQEPKTDGDVMDDDDGGDNEVCYIGRALCTCLIDCTCKTRTGQTQIGSKVVINTLLHCISAGNHWVFALFFSLSVFECV